MTIEAITMALLTHPYQGMLAGVLLFHVARSVLRPRVRATKYRKPEVTGLEKAA